MSLCQLLALISINVILIIIERNEGLTRRWDDMSTMQNCLNYKTNQINRQAESMFHIYIAKGGRNFVNFINKVTGEEMVKINEPDMGWGILPRTEAVKVWEYQQSKLA